MLLLPFDLSLSDMHKNYKSYYNFRRNSCFPCKHGIGSSFLFVLDCGFTESLIVTTFINPLRNKYIIQTIRTNIISNLIIFCKWIPIFNYISRLNSYIVIFFVCICVTFNFTFSYEIF